MNEIPANLLTRTALDAVVNRFLYGAPTFEPDAAVLWDCLSERGITGLPNAITSIHWTHGSLLHRWATVDALESALIIVAGGVALNNHVELLRAVHNWLSDPSEKNTREVDQFDGYLSQGIVHVEHAGIMCRTLAENAHKYKPLYMDHKEAEIACYNRIRVLAACEPWLPLVQNLGSSYV